MLSPVSLVQNVHDGQADVQTNKVAQLQGAHRVVGTQLHSGVDTGDVRNALHLDEGSLVDHGDQDAVDDEAGSLIDLNGALADLNADLLDGLDGLGGVFTPAMTSMSFMRSAGLKKCMPTRGRLRPLPISVMDREEVLEAKTHSGLADLVQLAKGGLLDLHILESSLNDQVAVSAQILLQASGDGSHAAVNLSLIQLALGNELGITGSNLVLAAIGPFLLDVAQSDGEALNLCKCFAMPWPIVPAPITPTFIVSTSKLCCCGAVGVGAHASGPRGVGGRRPYMIVVEFSYS